MRLVRPSAKYSLERKRHRMYFSQPHFFHLSLGANSAGHQVRVHPGLLVRCVHLDREEVSTSRPSRGLKTGSGDLLHVAPAQTRVRHSQPGGHRVPGSTAPPQMLQECLTILV